MNDSSKDPLLSDLAERYVEREREIDAAEQEADADWQAASQPLDAAARQRIVEHLKEVVADEPQVVPFPSPKPERRSRSPWRFALPLAAALGVVFSFLLYQRLFEQAPAQTLPTYVAQFQGASQAFRSAPGATSGDSPQPEVAGSEVEGGILRAASGNRIQVILTPAKPVEGALAGRAYLSQMDGSWQALSDDTVAVSEEGAVRFAAMVGSQLELTVEPRRLLLVVGEAATLPSPDQAADGVSNTGDGLPWRSFLWTLALDDAS